MRTRLIYKSPVAACVENIFNVFAVIKFNIKGINNPKKSAIHKNIPSIEIKYSYPEIKMINCFANKKVPNDNRKKSKSLRQNKH